LNPASEIFLCYDTGNVLSCFQPFTVGAVKLAAVRAGVCNSNQSELKLCLIMMGRFSNFLTDT